MMCLWARCCAGCSRRAHRCRAPCKTPRRALQRQLTLKGKAARRRQNQSRLPKGQCTPCAPPVAARLTDQVTPRATGQAVHCYLGRSSAVPQSRARTQAGGARPGASETLSRPCVTRLRAAVPRQAFRTLERRQRAHTSGAQDQRGCQGREVEGGAAGQEAA